MAGDLASLLAAGERAAFHGPPASAVDVLRQAGELATAQGRPAEATAAGWLSGVALSAAGRYGSALQVLDPLVAAGDDAGASAEARLFAALSAATAASVHRALGRHDDATAYDNRGLGLADARPEAVFDALLGLASDAVGLGQAEEAASRLSAAADLVGDRDEWWRQRVRLDWVRAEVALLDGRPDDAVEAAGDAVGRAEQARAPRHVAKGLLFQGVARLEAGSPAAVETLRRAATLAEGLGALPVSWPARALLGALLGDDPEAAASFAAAREAVSAIADDLREDLRRQWLARPDVAALGRT
ncbi:MAG TPA: hypothetical protein VFJ21_10855 [Mycobacteriales bacterium]|nr:hypothetical protein [Mycobacteriales bacterium]